jgi:mono/diheme cytochrome c family protein
VGAGKRQAPVLDQVGGRIRASYLKKFLSDPQSAKPGTLMPNLLHSDPEKEQKVEALVHFLASTGTLKHERPVAKALTQGRDLYHKVGCVACHGTRDARGKPETVLSTHVPMSDLEAKYSVTSLSAFLADPLHTRPSGRMPRLLTVVEAKSVASFLLQGLAVPLAGKGTTTFTYYEGSWDKLPDFTREKAKGNGVVQGFDINIAARGHNFAIQFECVLPIEREGVYTFSLLSDDGSRLWVNSKLIVDNDGLHAPQAARGKIKLTKGIHKVVVGFFQAGGGADLSVSVSVPGQGDRDLADLVAATEEALKKKPVAVKKDDDAIDIKPQLVTRGKQLFASLGCANCHQLKHDGKTIESALTAPAMAKLSVGKGCLSAGTSRGVPLFAFDDLQRKAIESAMASKPPVRNAALVVRETMTALNCYACHVRDKIGGPQEELNRHFQSTQPEMGDEGRLPPPLDGVGAKLTTEYFKHMLDRGVHDRPYMHTRMPGFGVGNAGAIVDAFSDLDKLPLVPAVKFKDLSVKVKSQARHLVGGLALGCIKCHTFNGQKAEGVQGIDMTLMPKRLKRDWFHAYIAEPQKIRPGTRMPTSYMDGKSVLPDILDGTARTQIEAMWVYLSEGHMARVPVGMGKVSLPLIPTTNAIIYRNFIEGGGTRAIAVGYPEKAHLTFDANELRLSMIWQGAFIDAARHWTDRGAGFEGPLGDNLLRLHSGSAFAILEKPDTLWPTDPARKLGSRFRGYRLTSDDRPTFLYSFADVHIEDFPNPQVAGKEVALKRSFSLTTTKPIANFYYRAAIGTKIESTGDGWYRIDDGWKVKVPVEARTRKAGGKVELLIPVTFKAGKAQFVQEYHW